MGYITYWLLYYDMYDTTRAERCARRGRIQSTLDAKRPSRVRALRQRSWSSQALAAAAVFGAVISSSVTGTNRHRAKRDIALPVPLIETIFER